MTKVDDDDDVAVLVDAVGPNVALHQRLSLLSGDEHSCARERSDAPALACTK